MSHLDFRISVARGLVTAGDSEIPDSASSVVGCPMRLLGRNHFPEPAGGMLDCVLCESIAFFQKLLVISKDITAHMHCIDIYKV